MSDDNALNFQRLQTAQLHQNLATAVSNDAMSGIAASQANQRARTLQENQANLHQQLDFHRNLLKQPMHVIAKYSPEFQKNHEAEQEKLAEGMVSQKACKELAIDHGLSREELKALVPVYEAKVLNNETRHGNNAADSSIIRPHIENLKAKLKPA